MEDSSSDFVKYKQLNGLLDVFEDHGLDLVSSDSNCGLSYQRFLKQNYRLMFKSTYRLICLFACVVQMAVLLPTVEKDARVVNQILDRNQHWYLFLLVVGLVILGTNKLVRRRLEHAMDLDHEREEFNWKFAILTPLFRNFDGLLILEAINVDYQGIHERFIPSITYEAKVRIRYTPIILYLQAPYDEIYSFGKLSSKVLLLPKRG